MNEEQTPVENETPPQGGEDYQALNPVPIAIGTSGEAERANPDASSGVAEATTPLQAKLVSLEAEVATKTQDIEALKGQLAEASTNFEGAKAAYAYAVDDFKALAVASNPLFTDGLIYGATIDDVKASITRAAAVVDKVKQKLQNEAQTAASPDKIGIPAGSPVRSGPDLSAMSTTEKINIGLEQARRKKE